MFNIKKAKILIATLLATAAVGCAKENKSGGGTGVPYVTPPPPGTPWTPPTNGPGQGNNNNQFGASATLSITSVSTMSQYTQRPMNNPTNIRVNVNLVSTGNNSNGTPIYGGTVSVSYIDSGYSYNGSFTSGTTAESTSYNIWYNFGGTKAFHGFFEDFMGGLILVIDQVIDLGDGGGMQDLAGGSVWFKNFGLTYAPHPPTYCWFVSLGPYDCRSWPWGDGVNPYQQITPNNGYIQLGTFSGLSLNKAFNGAQLK